MARLARPVPNFTQGHANVCAPNGRQPPSRTGAADERVMRAVAAPVPRFTTMRVRPRKPGLQLHLSSTGRAKGLSPLDFGLGPLVGRPSSVSGRSRRRSRIEFGRADVNSSLRRGNHPEPSLDEYSEGLPRSSSIKANKPVRSVREGRSSHYEWVVLRRYSKAQRWMRTLPGACDRRPPPAGLRDPARSLDPTAA